MFKPEFKTVKSKTLIKWARKMELIVMMFNRMLT